MTLSRAGTLSLRAVPTLVTGATGRVGRLDGIELIFHLASYTPTPKDPDVYQAPAHWSVTAEGTENLVDAALAAGVRRLVYLSSVKVMGTVVDAGGGPVDESVPPAPDTVYGQAKLAAERRVLAVGESGRLRASVLRAPMVYGLAGTGNIARMIEAVARNRFPPWPKIDNRRSSVHVWDLVAAALLAATHPRAAGRCYLVTDDKGYSTRWLYERIRQALGQPVPKWSVPYPALTAAAYGASWLEKRLRRRLPLNREGLRKLTENAWFSSHRIRAELGFEPGHNLEDEIPVMVEEYLEATRSATKFPKNGW